MKKNSLLLRVSLGFVTVMGAFVSVQAETTTDLDDTVMQGSGAPDLSMLKNQLEERENEISLLMEQGLVGITNEGLFEVRGKISPMQGKSIRNQNSDLKAYYNLVAKQKGEDVETVQKNSAAQMIKDAGPEVWVQDEEGDWYQK